MSERSPSDPRGINYYNTLIQVAPDCPVAASYLPVERGGRRTVALIQYELLLEQPYQLTQAELLFEVFAQQKSIPAAEREAAWEAFWAKPQACMRASPLPKQYGFGIHFDEQGRGALCPMESAEYQRFSEAGLTILKAMRSSRA